jgi:hypothetical protein
MRLGQATAFATAGNIQPLIDNDQSSSGIAPENATSIVSIATAALATKTPLKF